jgi:hypothetical protein
VIGIVILPEQSCKINCGQVIFYSPDDGGFHFVQPCLSTVWGSQWPFPWLVQKTGVGTVPQPVSL